MKLLCDFIFVNFIPVVHFLVNKVGVKHLFLIGKPRVQKSGREINAAKKTDFKSMMPHMPLRSGFLQNTRYLNNKIMFAKMYETTL